MNILGFTAQASLYRTSNSYRSSALDFGGLSPTQSVVLAYMPGSQTQAQCSTCLGSCAKNLAECSVIAGALLAPCVFPPACAFAAAAAGAALVVCDVTSLACIADCTWNDCCPKKCGTPNPFDPGAGCCDENEQCGDRYDANSRQGCCPSDQNVCGDKCCAKGESCCGDTCCPPNYFCRDGGFCSQFPSPLLPEHPTTPPPPPRPRSTVKCRVGYKNCGNTCCPPELECCYDRFTNTGLCKDSCGPR